MEELDPISSRPGQLSKTERTPCQTRSVQEKTGPGSNDPHGFSAVLSQRLQAGLSLAGTTGASVDSVSETRADLPELQGSFNAQSLGTVSDNQEKGYFVSRLDGLISSLDTYASWLSDPEKSLKQIQGLIRQMREETLNLAMELDQDSENRNSEALTQMRNRLSAIIETEQIKIDRGDYL